MTVHPPALNTLGPSELVGTYADGSDAWHEQRSTGIGGSEIASVAQIAGAFKSKYMLWLEKHGDLPPEELSPRTRMLFASGHALEPVVNDEFALRHPELTVINTGSWRRTDKPWALSNPDRLLIHPETGEIMLLEIKASGRGAGFESGFPPEKYIAQVRYYAGNLGITRSYLALAVGLGDYSEWLIPTDPTFPVTNMDTGDMEWYLHIEYDNLLDHAERFVESLKNHEAPPYDAGTDTYEYVRSQNPEIDTDKDVQIPLELAQRVHSADVLVKHYTDQLRTAKTEILDLMGNAKGAYVDDVRVAYRQANGRSSPTLYLARTQKVRSLVGEPLPQAA